VRSGRDALFLGQDARDNLVAAHAVLKEDDGRVAQQILVLRKGREQILRFDSKEREIRRRLQLLRRIHLHVKGTQNAVDVQSFGANGGDLRCAPDKQNILTSVPQQAAQ